MSNQQKYSRSSIWVSYSLVTLFLFYQYLLRVLPNNLMPHLMEKFNITAVEFSQFTGIYYIGYVMMHIPLGLLLDKYGPKYVLPICMILTGAGIVPVLFIDNWYVSVIGRLMIGMGSSSAILSLFKIIKIGFGDDRFTAMLGFSVTFGLIGAIYGGYPISYLFSNFDWEYILIILALISIGLAVISFFFLPQQKEMTHDVRQLMLDVVSVVTNPKILLITILGGLMVGPIEGFADAWGKQFLLKVYDLTQDRAATLPSLIFVGMAVGATFMSLLASKSKAYYEIVFIAGVVMAASFVLVLTGDVNISLLSMPSFSMGAVNFPALDLNMLDILFLAIGIMSAYQILVIYKATTYASGHLVGLTSACANMIIMIFGYFFHTVIGKVMDSNWQGATENGVRIYPPESFVYGISVIPICLTVAAVGFFFVVIQHRRKKVGHGPMNSHMSA